MCQPLPSGWFGRPSLTGCFLGPSNWAPAFCNTHSPIQSPHIGSYTPKAHEACPPLHCPQEKVQTPPFSIQDPSQFGQHFQSQVLSHTFICPLTKLHSLGLNPRVVILGRLLNVFVSVSSSEKEDNSTYLLGSP